MAVSRPGSTLSTLPATSGFAEYGLPEPLIAALAAQGIAEPFPIQSATLPHSLAGRDVLGRGRTGSGKTYAFALPVLARLTETGRTRPGRPRALILAPTRELVTQIEASFAPLAKALSLTTRTIFGGVSPNPQIAGLRQGADIVIACPGRLEDLMRGGHVRLDDVVTTVLDEADHMADLGFLPAVRRLLDKTPGDSQRLLFSATLDAGINVLVKRYLTDPVTHSVDSEQSPVSTMTHHVLHLHADDRLPVLVDLTSTEGRTLVFTRTKHRAKSLTKQLIASGIPAVELHGNLGQNARTRNLSAFSDGSVTTLVATDIAARGIHVDDVTLVLHADPPVEHKAYLHRSGRTARAGASGTVVTLMTDDQVGDVRDLTRKAGIKPRITRVDAKHPLLAELAPGERLYVKPAPKAVQPPRKPAAAKPPRRDSGGNGAGGAGGNRRAAGGGGGRAAGGGGRRDAGAGAGAARRDGGGSARREGGNPRRDGGTQKPAAGKQRAGGQTRTPRASGAGSAAAFSSGTRAGGRRTGGGGSRRG